LGASAAYRRCQDAEERFVLADASNENRTAKKNWIYVISEYLKSISLG